MAGFITTLALTALALGAGVSVVVQQALNADLRTGIHSPLWAAFAGYVVGALAIAVVLIATRETWPAAIQKVPLWSWSGGVFGTGYIVVSILLLPHFGAATLVALLITGQMIGSITFDHFGLFGLASHRLDVVRAAGAVLLVAGVVLIRR